MVAPLGRQWRVPRNVVLVETYLDAIEYLKYEAIVLMSLAGKKAASLGLVEAIRRLVSAGYLVADGKGIRRADATDYLLVYERRRDDEFGTLIRRYEVEDVERCATPIVEAEELNGEGERRVRIYGRCVSRDMYGCEGEEYVREFDGSRGMNWRLGALTEKQGREEGSMLGIECEAEDDEVEVRSESR